MSAFEILYQAFGGLGIFFYGMKAMSDSIQMVAGDLIKQIINKITSNRILGVLVGLSVTMLVQSSSITTVMVVGLVNSGLMKLTQAIAVIFGANIGTTITGWIISIKVGKYGLLFIAMGIVPMLFSKNNKLKQLGKVIFGIGLIFFGLDIMSEAFKPLRKMPEFTHVIAYFSGQNYGAYAANILIGCILTMIVQSSSAMLGITMTLATTGVLSYYSAASLILGENIGTTITALLASVGGNTSAKRSAYAHALFNVFGVVVVFSIFPYFAGFVDWLVAGEPDMVNAAGEHPNVAVHLATCHSIFNVTATLVFLPFLNVLARIVTKLVPDKKIKEEHHLVFFGDPMNMLPTTSLIQAQKELTKFSEIVQRMFDEVKTYIFVEGEMTTARKAKIKDYEQISDNIQKEMTIFLSKVMEHETSPEQSVEAQTYLKLADEIESVSDYLDLLCHLYGRFRDEGKLEGPALVEFSDLFNQVYDYYKTIQRSIAEGNFIDHSVMERKSSGLKLLADEIRDHQMKRVAAGEIKPLLALIYSDMVVALRKVRSHSCDISELVSKMRS